MHDFKGADIMENKNTYHKYYPNVYLAKSVDVYEKGDKIKVTTRYGKINTCTVHNLIATAKGYYYYSITRLDGMNLQERARRRSERRGNWAEAQLNKSQQYYNKASENDDFLSLGQPILVGHHSEKGHRKLFENKDRNMRKSIEADKKVEDHLRIQEHWQDKITEINLSIPESLDYFKKELAKAIDRHKKIKSGELPREHSFDLPYAKKKVNELTKKLDLAKKLWG